MVGYIQGELARLGESAVEFEDSFSDNVGNTIVKVDSEYVYFEDGSNTLCEYPLYELDVEDGIYIITLLENL